MRIERQILHNLACRLRVAMRVWRKTLESPSTAYVEETEPTHFAIMVEANNSFQAAKVIYEEYLGGCDEGY